MQRDTKKLDEVVNLNVGLMGPKRTFPYSRICRQLEIPAEGGEEHESQVISWSEPPEADKHFL